MTSKSQEFAGHTPGPWTADRMILGASKDRRSGFIVNGPDADPLPVRICDIRCSPESPFSASQANAALIAAAPALRAERDALREQVRALREALLAYRAAIRVDPIDVGFDIGAQNMALRLDADDARAVCAAAALARAALAATEPRT